MSAPSTKPLDIFFLVSGILIIIAFLGSTTPPESLEYIPDAVRGLTTLTGIFIAFMGFCLTYLLSRFENIEIRNWLRNRVPLTVGLILVVILLVAVAYSELVYGRLMSSYMWMVVGFIVISILMAETFLVLSIMEEAFQSAQKEKEREGSEEEPL